MLYHEGVPAYVIRISYLFFNPRTINACFSYGDFSPTRLAFGVLTVRIENRMVLTGFSGSPHGDPGSPDGPHLVPPIVPMAAVAVSVATIVTTTTVAVAVAHQEATWKATGVPFGHLWNPFRPLGRPSEPFGARLGPLASPLGPLLGPLGSLCGPLDAK